MGEHDVPHEIEGLRAHKRSDPMILTLRHIN